MSLLSDREIATPEAHDSGWTVARHKPRRGAAQKLPMPTDLAHSSTQLTMPYLARQATDHPSKHAIVVVSSQDFASRWSHLSLTVTLAGRSTRKCRVSEKTRGPAQTACGSKSSEQSPLTTDPMDPTDRDTQVTKKRTRSRSRSSTHKQIVPDSGRCFCAPYRQDREHAITEIIDPFAGIPFDLAKRLAALKFQCDSRLVRIRVLDISSLELKWERSRLQSAAEVTPHDRISTTSTESDVQDQRRFANNPHTSPLRDRRRSRPSSSENAGIFAKLPNEIIYAILEMIPPDYYDVSDRVVRQPLSRKTSLITTTKLLNIDYRSLIAWSGTCRMIRALMQSAFFLPLFYIPKQFPGHHGQSVTIHLHFTIYPDFTDILKTDCPYKFQQKRILKHTGIEVEKYTTNVKRRQVSDQIPPAIRAHDVIDLRHARFTRPDAFQIRVPATPDPPALSQKARRHATNVSQVLNRTKDLVSAEGQGRWRIDITPSKKKESGNVVTESSRKSRITEYSVSLPAPKLSRDDADLGTLKQNREQVLLWWY